MVLLAGGGEAKKLENMEAFYAFIWSRGMEEEEDPVDPA